MQKKILFYLVPLLAYCASLQAAELKIGYVNYERVMAESPQAKRISQELEKEFSPRKKRLIVATKELKKLEEKYTRDVEVMSEAERRKLDKDMISKKREIKRSGEEAQEDFNIRKNEKLREMQRQIIEVVQAFAKEQGFDLLLTGGVIYAGKKVDVTEQIQQKLR